MRIEGVDPSVPQRGLCLHTEPREVLPILEQCRGIDWEIATDGEACKAALAAHAPTVVFSIKHSEFPGEGHAPAVQGESVRWFHVGGSGIDHLLGYDAERVTVTRCTGVLAPFLGERAAAALLYLSAGIPGFVRAQASRQWTPTRLDSLAGKRVLIVGAGATGTELARRLQPFGATLVGIRRSGASHRAFESMHRPEDLHALLPEADVLSISVPLGPKTRGLIGERELGLLPDGAIVMNASRGAVLSEAALLAALDRNVAAAWLDVFEVEPLPAASPLWQRDDVLVTPHCADQVSDFPVRFADRFVELWASMGGTVSAGS